jgi:hypothetical protein
MEVDLIAKFKPRQSDNGKPIPGGKNSKLSRRLSIFKSGSGK